MLKTTTLCTFTMIIALIASSGLIAQQDKTTKEVKPVPYPTSRGQNPCALTSSSDKKGSTEISRNQRNAWRPNLKDRTKGFSIEGNSSENLKLDEQFVSTYISPTLGPLGKEYARNDFGQLITLPGVDDPKRENPFFYPSLYFDISHSPKILAITDNERLLAVRDVKNIRNEPLWMDVTFEVIGYCEKPDAREPTPEACSMTATKDCDYCDEPAIRVLHILPDQTISGTREQLPATLAGAVADLASFSLPFYSSSAFGTRSEAASKGAELLFSNLFPPRPFAYQHAYISSHSSFGWNFHHQAQLTGSQRVSLLGLHRTAAVLEVRKDVKWIAVKYYLLTRWSKRPNKFNDKYDLRSDNVCLAIPDEAAKPKAQYDKITSLEKLPLLIPTSEVCKIFQSKENQCDSLIRKLTGRDKEGNSIPDETDGAGAVNRNRLVEATPDRRFIIKASLEAYLGLTKPTPAVATPTPTTGTTAQ